MLDFSLLCLSLASLTVFSTWIRCPDGLSPIFTQCALIILLEFFGMVGLLPQATKLIFYASLIIIPFIMLNFILRNGIFSVNFRQIARYKSTLFFIIFLYVAFALSKNSIFFDWDVFSHWGLAAKDYFERGKIVDVDSSIFYKQYPPGLALFQYYTASAGHFSESNALFSTCILTFTPLILAFQGKKNIDYLGTLLLSVCIFIITMWLGSAFLSGYVDQLIGMLFFAGCFSAYLYIDQKLKWPYLIPIFWCLPLIKQSGIIFCLFIACFYVFSAVGGYFHHRNHRRTVRGLTIAIALLATSFGSKSIWEHYCVRSGIVALEGNDRFTSYPKFGEIVAAISAEADSEKKIILHNYINRTIRIANSENFEQESRIFINRLLGKIVAPVAPPIFWILLILCIFIFSVLLAKNRVKRKLMGLCVAYICCSAAYCFVHVMVYMFAMSSSEGTGMASYDRYLSSFLIGTGIFACSALFYHWKGMRSKITSIAAISGVATIVLVQNPSPASIRNYFFQIPPQWLVESRAVIQRDVRPILANIPGDKRVFIYYSGDNGYLYQIVRYEISPRRTNAGGSWDFKGPESEMAKLLSTFDYFYIGRSDPEFFTKYVDLLSPNWKSTPTDLYKIQQNSTRKYGIELVPMRI